MIRITITRAGQPMGEHVLQGEITVGRANDRHIVLSDPQVSRLHLVIDEAGGACTVIDQGSRNGTTVDGRRLTKNLPTPWTHGQELAIREFVLVAHAVAERAPEPLVEEFNYEETYIVAPEERAVPAPMPPPSPVEPAYPVTPPIAPSPVPAPPPPAPVAPVAPPAQVAPPAPVAPVAAAPAPAPVQAPVQATGPDVTHLSAHLLPAGDAPGAWTKGERTFIVADVIRETHDVNTFRFVPEVPVNLRFLPGQFVGITVEIDGEPVRRTYSISSSPSRPMALDLTVKRVPGGLVSNWLADNLSVGDRVSLRAPAGRFSCFNQPASKVLFLAAGSGVTPLMSMLRWIADVSAKVDVVVLNSIRTPSDLIFGRELESIASRHPNISITATVTHSRECSGGWLGLSGRVDLTRLQAVVPDLVEREVFMCGPNPFSVAMTEQLQAAGVPKDRIHQESFGGRPPQKPRTVPAVKPAPVEPVPEPDESFGTMIIDHFAVPGGEGAAPEAPMQQATPPVAPAPPVPPPAPAYDGGQTFLPPAAQPAPPPPIPPAPPQAAPVPAPAPAPQVGGKTIHFRTSGLSAPAEDGMTLLESAEAAGADIMSSCRQGQCGTCRTRKLSGQVTMDEHDLTPEELAEGWIYPCTSHANSDVELEA